MLVIIALLVYNHGHCFNSTAQEILINREDEIEKRNGPGTALRRWLDSDRILCRHSGFGLIGFDGVKESDALLCNAVIHPHTSRLCTMVWFVNRHPFTLSHPNIHSPLRCA